MKSLKKGLSVLLFLVLCGNMVIPAFAASFEELNIAINDTENTSGERITGTNDTFGYAKNEDGSYGITAWTDGEGEGATRHVELHEDVVHGDPAPTDAPEPGTYDNQQGAITVSGKVSIDTNGNTINGNDKGGIFDVQGDLKVNAENGGTIKGGSGTEGGAVHVSAGGSFEMNGGEMTGNKAVNNEYAPEGQNEGKGGAIYVETNGKATLNNTVVTGNDAQVNGDGIYAEDGATVNLEGKAEVSNNGDVDVYLEYNKETQTGAQLNAPEDVVWIDTKNEETTYTGEVNSTEKADSLSLKWVNPTTGGNGGYDGGDTEVEITDPDVPLAEGPVTAAEFIHKMWVLDGEPEPLDDRGLPAGVDEDHEFAQAIAWAASAEIVPVDSFDAETLLTVALAREYLTSFAAYADMAMPELVTLTGKDDDLVLNSDGVLDEFFGEKGSE